MPSALKSGRRHISVRRQSKLLIEALETRTLLSIATINVATPIRAVPSNLLGINIAPWDAVLTPAQDPNTLPLSQAAGFNAVRIGGGS
jgi:hypothetical protein